MERSADFEERANPLKVLAVVVAGGLILMALIHSRGYEAERTGKWPTTTGTVTESYSRLFEDYDVQAGSSHWFEPVVSYEYTVAGTRYSSSGVYQKEVMYFLESDLDRLLSRFRVGATVDVHYSPGDPSQSVLIPGHAPSFRTYLLPALAFNILVPLAVALAIWVIGGLVCLARCALGLLR